MHTLLDFRFNRKFYAEAGQTGGPARSNGKSGQDLIIKVPAGTLIRDMNTGKVIADIQEVGVPRVVLHGGRGGWGNSHFATPTRQAPNFAKPGVRTEIFDVQLELKTIADVGLGRLPQRGQVYDSVCADGCKAQDRELPLYHPAAEPRRGQGAFGRLRPAGGSPRAWIEGAGEGAGLGHEFLRHVERTRLLLRVCAGYFRLRRTRSAGGSGHHQQRIGQI